MPVIRKMVTGALRQKANTRENQARATVAKKEAATTSVQMHADEIHQPAHAPGKAAAKPFLFGGVEDDGKGNGGDKSHGRLEQPVEKGGKIYHSRAPPVKRESTLTTTPTPMAMQPPTSTASSMRMAPLK